MKIQQINSIKFNNKTLQQKINFGENKVVHSSNNNEQTKKNKTYEYAKNALAIIGLLTVLYFLGRTYHFPQKNFPTDRIK